MTDKPLDLDELERLALAATPGRRDAACINGDKKPWAIITDGPFGDEILFGYLTEQDSKFAEAVNPSTVLQLIAMARKK